MKYLIVIAALCVVAYAGGDMRQIMQECKDSECMHLCIMEKTGSMKNGEIDKQSILNIAKEMSEKMNFPYDEAEVGAAVDECMGGATQSDECEKATAFGNCMMKKFKGHGGRGGGRGGGRDGAPQM